ncbi:FkbM family methyltransferase [Roseibium sp.]|uniref:FkbM family methyltransferase n=1 Tax=Roseibium sp. TaxID=1936156 RepID=UPI003A9750E8
MASRIGKRLLKSLNKRLTPLNICIDTRQSQLEKDGVIDDGAALLDLALSRHTDIASTAQLQQDVFALLVNDFKRGGYFVEFGATNGRKLSNSYVLETAFQWNGIVAEPAKVWHEDLRKNRRCHIETDCVWKATGETLEFTMANWGELSTLSEFSGSDAHAKQRRNAQTYPVNTISLLDLLRKFEAPAQIDYLSVDTEGSELEILSAFDFQTYRFNCITVEHNFTATRERLHALLTSNGYRRVLPHLSRWDDWYLPITT